jgi:malate synthase
MIEISQKVSREFKDLLGEKVVNGRRVVVEELIEEMARRFQGEISKAVRARREWLEDRRPVREKAAFPRWATPTATSGRLERSYKAS